MKRICQASILVLAVAAMHGRLSAQQAPDANTVVEVRVEGNKALRASDILANVKTRAGQPYDDKLLGEDQRRLLDTGWFSNVMVTRLRTERGVIVTFQVTERPVVEAIRFEGNKAFKAAVLQRSLPFGLRAAIDRHKVVAGAAAIRSRYRSAGYHFVKVSLDEVALRDRCHVIYRIVEGPKVILKKIIFKGNESLSDRRLKGVIKSRAKFWPFEAGTLDSEAIDRDVVELRNFYRGEGFLNAQVARQLGFTPKRQAILTFVIEEGLRFRIRRPVFRGNSVYSADALRSQLRLVAGAEYKADDQQRDIQTIRRLYGEIGYIDATIEVRTVYTDQDGVVDLAYTISEGGQFRVGQIDIRGNQITKDKVIRRELPLQPGHYYDNVALEQARRRLELETGLYQKVTITPFGDAPGVRNALVEVTEGKTGLVMFGAGLSSNAGLLGTISFSERNFDLFTWPTWADVKAGRAFRGGGQTFSIVAEPGTEFMRFRINWREPYLFDKPLSLGVGSYLFTTGRESYDETRYGGVVSLGRRFPNRWYGELAGRIEAVRVDSLDTNAPADVTKVKGSSALFGVKGTLVRDRTDSHWSPSAGDRLSFNYEQVAGDHSFGRATAEYRRYHTLYTDALERKHILAGRVAGGAIIGDAPVFERFYGGGLGSVRGFDFRGISPRQGIDADPIGGEYMIFAGAEYTFPLVGNNLRGVLFLDSGTVEPNFSLSDYRVSTGFGIRWRIPFLGPMPMDFNFGFPLSKSGQDDTEVFSFSIGWAF